MSGPKVVRIVTREEMEEICRRSLAAVDAAVAGLLRAADEDDAEALEKQLTERRRSVAALRADGRFLEMQKEAAAMTAFLAAEAELRKTAAQEAARQGRQSRRRLAAAARSAARAHPGSAAELRALAERAMTASQAALDAEQANFDALLRGLVAATTPGAAEPTENQRALAARLGAGTEPAAAWQAPLAAIDGTAARIDAALAQLETLAGAGAARAFAAKAAALMDEPEQRQALLADSLLLELGAELRRRRAAEAVSADLRSLGAQLAGDGTAESARIAAEIEATLAAGKAEGAEPLATAARARLERSLAELAAAARRKAVLAGLASLGYEVRENLATAWARDGRILLQKPASADYGIELGAPADAARLQLRLVGAEQPREARSAARDRDQETLFCQDFEQLRELVAAEGGEIAIERALAPGEAPVKTVRLESVEAERSQEASPLQRRVRSL